MTKRKSPFKRLKWRVLAYTNRITPLLVFFNICPCCLRHDITVCERRTRTAYHNDRLNYETTCADCFEDHDAYWQERWEEYYASVL